MITSFAIAAGEYADKIGRSHTTAEDLKREIKDVPDAVPLAVFHEGKPAPVYGVDKVAGRLEIIAGEPGRVTDTWTAGQLRKRLFLCPDSCSVVVSHDEQIAPVYGFNKIIDEQAAL